MKNTFKILSALLLLVVTANTNVFSASRYWIATSAANWNSTSNWSTTSGGSSGASVPGSSDVAYFDGNGTGNCTINANANVLGFNILSGYTDTIFQNSSYTVTIGTSSYNQAGGVYKSLGTSGTVFTCNTFNLTGGVFIAPSSTMCISGTASVETSVFKQTGGTFTHNNGQLTISSSVNGKYYIEALQGTEFYDVYVNVTNTYGDLYPKTMSSIVVKHNLTHYSGYINGDWYVYGNLYVQQASSWPSTDPYTSTSKGNAKIHIVGTGTQEYFGNGTVTANLLVQKSSGTFQPGSGCTMFGCSTFELDSGTFVAPSNYILVGGTVFSHGMTMFTHSGGTFSNNSGTVVLQPLSSGYYVYYADVLTSTWFYNLTAIPDKNGSNNPGRLSSASGDTLKISNTFTHDKYYIEGDWRVEGDFIINATALGSTTSYGGGNVRMTGSGNQTYYCNGGGSTANLIVEKTGGTVSPGTSTLSVSKFSLSSGSFTAPTGNFTISGAFNSNQTIFNHSGGTFSHNNGTVILQPKNCSTTLYIYYADVIPSTWFYNLTAIADVSCSGYSGRLSSASGDTVKVSNTFTHDKSYLEGNWRVEGNFVINANALSSTTSYGGGNVRMTGSGNQTYYCNGGGSTANLIVEKTGGTVSPGTSTLNVSKFSLSSGSFTAPTGNFTISGAFNSNQTIFNHSGGTFSHNNGTVILQPKNCSTTLYIYYADVIPSTWFYNLTAIADVSCSGYSGRLSSASGDTVKISNTFTHDKSYIEGDWRIEGDFIINPSAIGASYSSGYVGAGSIRMTGSGNQTCYCNGGGSTANLIVEKTGGTVSPGTSTLSVSKFSLSSGSFTAPTGNFTISGTFNSSQTIFAHTGGTFSHNNGTVILQPKDRSASYLYYYADVIPSTWFYNLTAIADAAPSYYVCHLSSTNGDSIKVNNTLIHSKGYLEGDWYAKGDYALEAGVNSENANIIFAGENNQNISSNLTTEDRINGNVIINKPSGKVYLQKAVKLDQTGKSLTLTKGNIVSTSTNLLTIGDNVTVSGGTKNSFIEGPMKKIGNDIFEFPLGSDANYRIIKISAPSVTTDAYTAEYFNTGQTYGSSADASLQSLNDCEYWNLSRNAGTSNVYVTLSWDTNSCNITDINTLKIGGWDGSMWKDLGNGAVTGNIYNGTIKTASTVTTYNAFLLNKQIKAEAGENKTICNGGNTTIGGNPTASGGSGSGFTYTWYPSTGLSSVNTANPTANPTETTTYTVTITDGASATNADNVVVTVNSLPTVAATGATICNGSTANITASGANTYTWSTSETVSSITVNPTITSTYSVSGTDGNGCTNTAEATATVNPLPTITAIGDTTFTGDTTNITASGANTYSWSNDSIGSTITINPIETTTYTVTGTNGNGCANTAQAIVSVYPAPHVITTGAIIHYGDVATVTISGANTYTWSNSATTSSTTVAPTITTKYAVTFTDIQLNLSTDTAVVFVNDDSDTNEVSFYPNEQNSSNRTINQSLPVGTIAGTFDVSQNGAATYNIPIILPPGTAGMVPDLSIYYNSRSGMGTMGMGWGLSSFSSISRTNKNKYYDGIISPVNLDEDDVFALDGERLIYDTENSMYRTENESFSKITSNGTNGGVEWFKVETKSGITFEYGHSEDSKITLGSTNFSWLLNKVYDANGNYYTYTYDPNNNYIPLKIEYTGNASSSPTLTPYNSVNFYYDRRTDYSPNNEETFDLYDNSYIAGHELRSNSMILKRIEIKNESAITKQYEFSYVNSCYPHLTEITEYGSDAKHFNSTIINYGDKTDNLKTYDKFNVSRNSAVLYSGDFNGDGLSDIMSYEDNDEDHGLRLYLSRKEAVTGGYSMHYDQSYDVFLSATYNDNYQMQKDAGTTAADFNGDGKQDFLFIEWNTTGTRTYTLKTYISSGTDINDMSLTQTEETAIAYTSTSFTDSNYPKFITGDFDGDGIQEIIVFGMIDADGDIGTFGYRIYKYNATQNTMDKIVDTGSPMFNGGDKTYCDNFKGTKITDILYWNSSLNSNYYKMCNFSVDVYGVISMSTNTTTIPSSDTKPLLLGDFNGDGKTDVLRTANDHTPGWTWEIYFSNGTDFSYLGEAGYPDFATMGDYDRTNDGNGVIYGSTSGYYNYYHPDELVTGKTCVDYEYIVGDYNGDGKSDIAEITTHDYEDSYPSGYITFNVFYSKGVNSFIEETSTVPNQLVGGYYNCVVSDELTQGDFNGDGNVDILYSTKDGYLGNLFTFHPDEKNQLVKTITNGLNVKTNIEYACITDQNDEINDLGNIYLKDETGYSYPIQSPVPPMYVVSTVTEDNGVGSTFNSAYQYQGYKLNLESEADLGFTKVKSVDESNIITTEYELLNTEDYCTVALKSETVKSASDNPVSETIYTNDVKDFGNKIIFPYITEEESTNSLLGTTNTTLYSWNSTDLNNGNLTSVSVNYNGDAYTTASYEYTSAGNWDCPNKISNITVTKTRTGETGSYIRTVDNTYNTDGSLATSVRDQGQAKSVTTNHTYYSNFGNLHTTTISASGLSSRTSTLEYDEKGRFVTKSTNSLNQFSEAEYDSKTGNVTSSTDINGLITTYTYDGFGRPLTTILPIGATGQTINYSAEWNINGNKLYKTKKTFTGTSDEINFFDCLGRNLRSETYTDIGNTQKTIYSETQYDNDGLVEKTFALPTTGSALETDYIWDEFERITTVESPVLQTDYFYGGLTTTVSETISGNTRAKTTTIDGTGSPVSIVDDGGAVSYTYNNAGLVKQITTNGSTTQITYDDYGNQTQLIEPNSGTTSYTWNAYGEITDQIDANGNTSTITYDVLGRPVTAVSTEGTTSYTYDTETNGVGMLASVSGPESGYDYRLKYDEYGRTHQIIEKIDGTDYNTYYDYDNFNRVNKITYPHAFSSVFAVNKFYTNFGYLKEVKRDGNNQTVWKATSMNNMQQIDGYSLGNNNLLPVTKTFDTYGYLEEIKTQNSGQTVLQDLQYNFEHATGNMLWRKDVTPGRNLTENFTYDNKLDRLTAIAFGSNTVNIDYSNNGNIHSKSDVNEGTYQYHATKVNAVTSVGEGSGQGISSSQTINYNSFNKITDITQGIQGGNYNKMYFNYGPNQSRKKVETYLNTTLIKTKYYSLGYEKEVTAGSGSTREWYYIDGADGLAAIFIQDNGTNGAMHYALQDNLGSITALVNESGTKEEEYSYDAWGRRRNVSDWTYANVPTPSLINRGYTGHEHMDNFGLINMNGRLYDPLVGRMLSVDPFVADATSSQAYNRYSYSNNNPLTYMDPSGYMSTGHIARWRKIPRAKSSDWNEPDILIDDIGAEGGGDGGAEGGGGGGSGHGGGGSAHGGGHSRRGEENGFLGQSDKDLIEQQIEHHNYMYGIKKEKPKPKPKSHRNRTLLRCPIFKGGGKANKHHDKWNWNINWDWDNWGGLGFRYGNFTLFDINIGNRHKTPHLGAKYNWFPGRNNHSSFQFFYSVKDGTTTHINNFIPLHFITPIPTGFALKIGPFQISWQCPHTWDSYTGSDADPIDK
ncbi:MAG: RHS repeat-associated core domain-containing protein [Bacteroidales bacterium]|jgi:RHS repeat-associated protein